MKFQKGLPRPVNAGRKKGSLNKKRVPKVSDYLAEKDLNPVKELLALLDEMKPKEQAEVWLDLLSYCQTKPKIEEELPGEPGSEGDLDDIPSESLLKIVKNNGAS